MILFRILHMGQNAYLNILKLEIPSLKASNIYAPAQQLKLEEQVSSLHDLQGLIRLDQRHSQVGIFVRIKTDFSSQVPTRDLDAQRYLMFDRQNTDEDEIALILLRETASLGFILKDQ
ncbi:uncharacterized protein RAG0_10916 [Rhynchosporium agropyri]|uniref:Uncharacterized protein n=1 Tax=Rhynchosporium agropyri TaxID=914238 RepID=A0A1E1L1Z8_9HELO|nr:uncharacterized protein RAG0_10916 [Rhynchosporium agropyri]